MLPITVSSNSSTSWNTAAKSPSSTSGSTVDTSTPPTVIVPELASQKRAASLEHVDLPEPDGPTSAVTSPSFAVKDTSSKTCSPSL